MKRRLIALPLAAFLAACSPQAPAPYVAPQVAASGAVAPVQAAAPAPAADTGMSPVTAGLLGAAAGYFMGSSRRPAAVPAPAVIERHTVVVREAPRYIAPRPVAAPAPRLVSPGPARISAFRPSNSFRRR